jgi:hypothetical protein
MATKRSYAKTGGGMGGGGGGSWGEPKPKPTPSATILGRGASDPSYYQKVTTQPTQTFQAPKTTSTYTAPKVTTTNTTASIAPATPSVDPGNTPPPDFDYDRDPGAGGGGNTGLDMSYYEEMLRRQQEAIQQRINAAVDANNAYIPQVNQQSDKALQNAYILREQNRVNAPQALSALGYTGGAAETSLMGIQTGYENTRNQVEQSRAQALEQIRQNEQQIRATGDATLSEAAADYYNKLIAANEQAKRDAQAQANWEAEFGLRQKEYEDAAAQQAWQNAYDERVLKYNQSKSSGSGGSSGPTKQESYAADYSKVNSGTISPSMIEANAQALIAQYGVSGYNDLLQLAKLRQRAATQTRGMATQGLTNQGMSLNWWER